MLESNLTAAGNAARIVELFEKFDQPGSPGATVAIALDGEVVESHSFGEASLEHAVPNARDTVFYIASTSKQFVGCAAALLEADGLIDLDDEVVQYIPELHRFDPPVRIRHLLHHTSGLRDKYGLAAVGRLPEAAISTDVGSLQLLARQRTLNFEPGSRFMYSNSNYFLLAQLVERVSGMPFSAFAAQRIFEPLGMSDTRFRPDTSVVIPRRASGYRRGQDGQWHVAEYTWNSLGPGGVVTTVDDLATWSTTFFANRLAPTDLAARLLRTEPLTDGTTNNYALGVTVDPFGGVPTVSHGGGVPGFGAEMMTFPDRRLSVICLANTPWVGAQARARQIATLYLGDAVEPVAPRPEQTPGEDVDAGRFVGTYLAQDETGVYRIAVEGDSLVLRAGSQSFPLTVVRESLLCAAGGTDLELVLEGAVLLLRAPGGSGEIRCQRLETIDASTVTKASLHDYVGTYHSAEIGATVVVRVDGEDLVAQWPWTPAGILTPIGRDLFLVGVEEEEIPLRFERDESGVAVTMRISIGRALGNRFERSG